MISNWAIQSALRTQLLTVEGIPGEDHHAWENMKFKPTHDTPWIRETLLPGEERLTANNEVEAVGICQYDYFVPMGSSIKAAKDLADRIKTAFKPMTVVGGVLIERSYLLPGERGASGLVSDSGSSPWYRISVAIHYKEHSTNQ